MRSHLQPQGVGVFQPDSCLTEIGLSARGLPADGLIDRECAGGDSMVRGFAMMIVDVVGFTPIIGAYTYERISKDLSRHSVRWVCPTNSPQHSYCKYIVYY